MKKFCFIGPADKRLVIYPLLRCLSFMGKTLVITDNPMFKRFSDDYNTDFELGTIEFKIIPKLDEQYSSEIKIHSSVDYVIYDLLNELPKGDIDKIFYCHGINKCICREDVIQCLKGKECVDVYITMSKVKDMNSFHLKYTKDYMSYVCECEENREFVSYKNTSYSIMIDKFFQKEIQVSLKESKSTTSSKAVINGLMERNE